MYKIQPDCNISWYFTKGLNILLGLLPCQRPAYWSCCRPIIRQQWTAESQETGILCLLCHRATVAVFYAVFSMENLPAICLGTRWMAILKEVEACEIQVRVKVMPKSFLLVSPNVWTQPQKDPWKGKPHQFSYRSARQGIFQELFFFDKNMCSITWLHGNSLLTK